MLMDALCAVRLRLILCVVCACSRATVVRTCLRLKWRLNVALWILLWICRCVLWCGGGRGVVCLVACSLCRLCVSR